MRHDGVSLYVMSDSLGQLSCLARGPCRQDEYIPTATWRELLGIADGRDATLAFVFSHCGFEPNDAIDALAATARAAPGAPPAVWWRDAARPGRAMTKADNVARARRQVNWRRAHCPRPDATVALPRKSLRVVTPLMRMRTGVDPGLGGWRKRFTDPCPLCNAPLTRDDGGVSGVAHFLVCPDARAAALRAEIFDTTPPTPDMLWHDEDAWRVLDYRNRLVALETA
jgi:hypothetical protein